MRPVKNWLQAVLLSTGVTALGAEISPSPKSSEPFDYFRNSWQVIGLRDYRDGSRVTPENDLLLAGQRKLRLACGPSQTPLGRRPVKTLLEGWMPVVLLNTEEGGVRYEFTLWSTPLPGPKNWREAFDWPTNGENFLNWIQVRATNRGAVPAQARVTAQVLGKTNGPAAAWTAPLGPGKSATTVFREPFAPVADASSFEREKASVWLARTVDYWRGLMAPAARIEVPCAKATQTLKAAHVCQLIASDHGELHAGEGFYDEFYIRDGGYQLLELEEAGLWDAASKGIASYLRAQRPDGRFESQAGQLDANGQALWTLWQYWKITGDPHFLRRVYPSMSRSAKWIQEERKKAPPGSAFAGLLPAAPADGEFLWDGKHHIVGYDIWNLRGLYCAAEAARALGRDQEEAEWQREAADYRKAIDAACARSGLAHFPPSWEKVGTPWGNTETLWPTELFEREDPRVIATVAEARERHGGGFAEGTIRWTGQPNVIHPYLSSYTSMASLLRGEHETFVKDLYWYLLHSSASHAFPEGIYFKRRYAWGETIPHVLGAANFAFMLRHGLLHERDGSLHLLMGVPDWWLEPGREIIVERAPTYFGTVGMTVRGVADGVRIKLDLPRGLKAERVVVHLPASRPLVGSSPKVTVATRTNQAQRWDFPTVVGLYQNQPTAPLKPIPGLVSLPLTEAAPAERCELLDLSALANTDPFQAPFGVPRPGRYLFTGMATGVQRAGGVPFRILDPAANQQRGLVVLQGAPPSSTFPREVTIPVKAQGRRLFFLGNVHGFSADDEGAGDWGAVAEYVIHYADGQTQSVPLITRRTADDWANEPEATETVVGLKGDPWHLNVLGVTLRPVAVDRIVFRDLGTPAAPVLAAVTLEK